MTDDPEKLECNSDSNNEILFGDLFDTKVRDLSKIVELKSAKHNSLIQTIGIVVAFASVILVNAMVVDPKELDGFSSILYTAVPVLCLIACCVIGAIAIIIWCNHEPVDPEKVSRYLSDFRNDRSEETSKNVEEAVWGVISLNRKVSFLVSSIRIMIILLLIGLVTRVVGWACFI